MQKKAEGHCPPGGCITHDSKGWRIISNKDGHKWPQVYKSKESAQSALKAYHAHKGASILRTIKAARALISAAKLEIKNSKYFVNGQEVDKVTYDKYVEKQKQDLQNQRKTFEEQKKRQMQDFNEQRRQSLQDLQQ